MAWKDTYKLVIFDCDGTLVDSERISNALIAEMMNELGIEMTEEYSLKLFKGTHFEKITDYVRKHAPALPAYDFENEYRKRCKKKFKEELKEIKGVSAFIQKLTVPCCVASNGPHVKMKASLGITGIDKLIAEENVFSAYDIGKFKPDPCLFLYAASKLDTPKEHVLVIEDTVPGIEAARKAGMDVWAIYHPGINEEVLDYGIPTFLNFEEIKI